MRFWTLKDRDGSYYIDEFKSFKAIPNFTDKDARKARMGRNTIDEFFNDGFKPVFVKIKEVLNDE